MRASSARSAIALLRSAAVVCAVLPWLANVGARAQTPVPPPSPPAAPSPPVATPAAVPAIELLLAKPRAPKVEIVRRRWARARNAVVESAPTDNGAWLRAAGERLEGGVRGVRFEVVATAEPRTIADAAVAHLDAEDRERVRSHRATIAVRAVGDTAGGAAARTATYRVLGGVASALLVVSDVGVGAAEHATFEAVGDLGAWRERLTGDDPLSALEPTSMSSVLLLLRAPRQLDEKALEAAITRELGITFAEDAPHFVAVRDTLTAVKIGDALVLVTPHGRDEDFASDSERFADLRMRRGLADHRAVLHLATSGPIGARAEAERRRLLARLVAAMWSDDVLLLSWHCDRRLVAASADVPAQLRAEDPVAATLGNPVVPVLAPPDEAAMEKAIAAARATWATAVAHHEGGGTLSAKFPFKTRRGEVEHIWIAVTSIDGDAVKGTIDNEPHDIEGLKVGSPVECRVAELSDWLFLKDGTMVGGHTVKALDAKRK